MPAQPRRNASPRSLRTLFNLGAIGDLTDGQLLERFATRDGESAELAFAALVERHGPMVLRSCRSVLRDPNDAQDAFQATFLVLARRADGLWVRDSIGPWLFSVALRVSRRARSAESRRRRHERQSAERAPRQIEAHSFECDPAESPLLAELDRLPARYRDPVVLCDLQGRSYDQAARHLGLPVGTLKSRLARGRSRLRDRLGRLGYAPSLAAAALALPGSLIDSTSSAALRAAAGLTTAGTVPAPVLVLASGALWMMRLTSLIRWSAAALAIALSGAGLANAGLFPGEGPPNPPRFTNARKPSPPAATVRPEQEQGPMLSYSVTFIEVPGFAVREMGIDQDFEVESPKGVAFLSDLEGQLILRAVQGNMPGASAVRAPTVLATPGSTASISLPRDATGLDVELTTALPAGPIAPDDHPPREDQRTLPAEPIAEGTIALIRGTLTDDQRYIRLALDISDVHVVEVHTVARRGDDGREDSEQIEIPEVVRTRFEPQVTLPDGATVLFSLGPRRTVDGEGRSSITDPYLLIEARKILPEPGRVSTPAALPPPSDPLRPLPLGPDSLDPLPPPTESLRPLPPPAD